MKRTTLLITLPAFCLSMICASGQEQRPPKRDQGRKYTLEQAVSDRAQLNTIAFDGLAFLTGNFGSCTFLPPGKVSDYFGFQYMRDIDAGEKGHNTSFLTRIANNTLAALNEAQMAQLVALGKEQAPLIRELAIKRFPLIKAFNRQLEGDIPPGGSSGLDRAAVMHYSAAMWELDGSLAYRRAQVTGAIIRSLDEKQKVAEMLQKDNQLKMALELIKTIPASQYSDVPGK